MRYESIGRRAAGIVGAAIACAASGGLALAQTPPMEVITVEAERSEKVA